MSRRFRRHSLGVAPLIPGLSFDARLADKAFDNNWNIEEMKARRAINFISQRPQRSIEKEMSNGRTWSRISFVI